MGSNSDDTVSTFLNNGCTDSFTRRGEGHTNKTPITCTDKRNQRYIECLFDQNGYTENMRHYTSFGPKHVRGEILESFNSDNEIEGDYQHSHSKTEGEQVEQKESVHNTLCKSSYKSSIKPEAPRKLFSIDFPAGSCDGDRSVNVQKIHNSGALRCQGNGHTILFIDQDISDNDSGLESMEDSLYIHMQIFVEHINANYQHTPGNVSNGSKENVNCVESDGGHSNFEIIAKDGIYNRADCAVPNGTEVDAGRYTSSHGPIVIDAIRNKDNTGPEPFIESFYSELNIEKGYVSSENSESLSCIESINISSDNDSCLDVHLIAADNTKKDDDDDDNNQDEYVKKHQHSLARDYSDQPSTQVESTENTTSRRKSKKLNKYEEQEPSIYNHLNEPQSDDVMLYLNLCNSKLRLVPNRRSFSQNMRFHLGSISQTESNFSPRVSNLRLTRSGCCFNEKGIKIAVREVSTKQSQACDEPRSLDYSNMQSQLDSFPFSELGIAERDPDFKPGTLARWSSDDENPFKQRSGLRWIFQFGFVLHESVLRLQHWLRHQFYPFTNIKDFWDSLGTNSPPSLEECMSVEWMRYQTFQNYPISAHGSPSRLARDGFYYTGQGTQTRCFSCGITHSDWNRMDNPHEVHQRLSPNCPFLNGRWERYPNIPMSPDGSMDVGRADRDSIPPPSLPVASLPGSGTSQSQAEGSRFESRKESRVTKTSAEDDSIGLQQSSGSGETTPTVQSHPVEELAQSEADNRPKFPEHVSLPSRIATFSRGWPPYLDQTPQQMAEAGFFFTGNQDYTRCYQCGGGLRNWEPGDNPWIEHCRWYPTCSHVQKGKGQRFVNAVLKKQAELLATQRTESRRKAQYGIGSTDPLETLAAITLLEIGYPRDTVRNSILILRRQREPGTEITAQDVLDFIWKEEDIERQRQEEEASRPHRPGDAQPPALPTLMERLNLAGLPAVTQAAVQELASITTTTSSLTTAAMTVTSVTMGISSITSVSTPTSATGSTQSSDALGQGQRPDEGQGHNTSIGGNGNRSGGSMQRDGMSKGTVGGESAVQNHERSEQGEQRPSGAIGGQSEEPGAHAQAIAAAIDEDEEFHSLDSEEMENKDLGELEEENKKLKEQTTCKICMENPIRVIFIPCGHLVCCETCAPAFRKCPICRKRIQQSVKTYL